MKTRELRIVLCILAITTETYAGYIQQVGDDGGQHAFLASGGAGGDAAIYTGVLSVYGGSKGGGSGYGGSGGGSKGSPYFGPSFFVAPSGEYFGGYFGGSVGSGGLEHGGGNGYKRK